MLPAIDFIHFIGIFLSDKGALSLEAFKKRTVSPLIEWEKKYPQLTNIPPVYWSIKEEKWVLLDIPPTHVVEYVRTCGKLLDEKIRKLVWRDSAKNQRRD
jgi:hypothetical protein